jgi:hypothetical protein
MLMYEVYPQRQPAAWACWFTAFEMLTQFYRENGAGDNLIAPSEDVFCCEIFNQNKGIGASSFLEREYVATKLGYKVKYGTLSIDDFTELLSQGPFIYAGVWPNIPIGHWVVIRGLDDNTLYYCDPATGHYQSQDFYYFMTLYLKQNIYRPIVYTENVVLASNPY